MNLKIIILFFVLTIFIFFHTNISIQNIEKNKEISIITSCHINPISCLFGNNKTLV